MTVIEQTEPQETLADNETVVGELSDGMRLIRTPEKGIIRPPSDSGRQERHYDQWKDAALFFGLWLETNGWTDHYPTSGSDQIPVEIVAEGKDAVAAYIRCGTGVINTRESVSRMLNVSEQTVSNYWNRIRYEVEE